MKPSVLHRAAGLLVALTATAPAWAAGGAAAPETVWGLPTLFWKAFNFVLFFGVLGWLLHRPIAQYLRSRREGITNQLSEARRQREEAEQLEQHMESRIAGLQQEIAALRQRLHAEGEREREALARQGEGEAERLLAQIELETARRIDAARSQLAREASETAVQLARELLARELGPDDQERIFRSMLERLQQKGGPA